MKDKLRKAFLGSVLSMGMVLIGVGSDSEAGQGTLAGQPSTAANLKKKDITLNHSSIRICARMPDGTVYVGISPDTQKPFYALLRDEPLDRELIRNNWYRAIAHAKSKNADGHRDWRVPTSGELNVLFKNRAAIGGFNTSGAYPGGWYWSSTDGTYYHNVKGQHFSTGTRGDEYPLGGSSVRLVRG